MISQLKEKIFTVILLRTNVLVRYDAIIKMLEIKIVFGPFEKRQ